MLQLAKLQRAMFLEGINMHRKIIAVVALLVAFAAFDPAAAQRLRTGMLSCDVSGGFGFIIGSQRSVICTFSPDGGQPEVYTGTISRFGLDIGVTTGGHMVWAVFAEYAGPRPGVLAGEYIGATGEATVAVGLGANVLVGGSNRQIALQPLSVSGQVGLNLAVGVADLRLRPGR
jgi:Protein of unknown function (DUF992)